MGQYYGDIQQTDDGGNAEYLALYLSAQHQQLGEIAAIERQVNQSPRFHHLRDGILFGLHLGGVGGDLDALGHGANLQGDGGIAVARHLEFNALLDVSLKTGRRDFELIMPDGKVREHVAASAVRDSGMWQAGVYAACLDLRTGNSLAAWVGDVPIDLSSRYLLCPGDRCQETGGERHQNCCRPSP